MVRYVMTWKVDFEIHGPFASDREAMNYALRWEEENEHNPHWSILDEVHIRSFTPLRLSAEEREWLATWVKDRLEIDGPFMQIDESEILHSIAQKLTGRELPTPPKLSVA